MAQLSSLQIRRRRFVKHWPDSVISKINECVYAPKDKYKNAHSNPIQNNQKLQTTRMSTEVRMGKELLATHELRCIQQ